MQAQALTAVIATAAPGSPTLFQANKVQAAPVLRHRSRLYRYQGQFEVAAHAIVFV